VFEVHFLLIAFDKSDAHVLGSEWNLEHARGCDESACASGLDAYNNFFAHPRAASLFNEYSDAVSRARLYYNDFAELKHACSSEPMIFLYII